MKPLSPRLFHWLVPLALAAAVAGLFGFVAGAPLTRDDILVTEQNPHAFSHANLARYFANDLDWLEPPGEASREPASRFGLYRPVLAASYHLDAALWGKNFSRWRWTNIALHLAVALSLLGLARRVLDSRWAAAIAAGLFSIHPVHAEAVSWLLGGRAELLSALGSIVSFWLFCPGADPRRFVRALRQAGSAACFLLALWSKENAMVLPAVLFLHAAFEPPPSAVRALRRLAPHLLVLAGYLVLRWAVLGRFGPSVEAPALLALPPLERVAALPFLLFQYLRLAVFPHPLQPAECAQTLPASFSPALGLLAGVALLGLLFAAFLGAWRARRNGGATVPYLAILWFFCLLLPASHLLPFPVLFAERFLYLPSAAVCLLAGWAIPRLARARAWLPWAVGLPLAGAWLAQTAVVNARMADPVLQFEAAARCRPDDPDPVNNLGTFLLRTGRAAEALERFERAAAMDPARAEARYNRALALQRLGREPDAIAAYRELLRTHPGHALALNNLGVLLLRSGEREPARKAFRQAYFNDPAHPAPLLNLAEMARAENDLEQAERLYRRALSIDADDDEARFQLGRLLESAGRPAEAEALYREILRRNPDHAMARNNLANLQKDRGEIAAAEENYRAALAADPGCAAAHYNLGNLLLALGRPGEAATQYRAALAIDDGDVASWIGLGYSELALGRAAEAAAAAAQAFALAPGDPRTHRLLSRVSGPSAP